MHIREVWWCHSVCRIILPDLTVYRLVGFHLCCYLNKTKKKTRIISPTLSVQEKPTQDRGRGWISSVTAAPQLGPRLTDETTVRLHCQNRDTNCALSQSCFYIRTLRRKDERFPEQQRASELRGGRRQHVQQHLVLTSAGLYQREPSHRGRGRLRKAELSEITTAVFQKWTTLTL